jgi:predicted DNA-binding transcriptional regulator AlpA
MAAVGISPRWQTALQFNPDLSRNCIRYATPIYAPLGSRDKNSSAPSGINELGHAMHHHIFPALPLNRAAVVMSSPAPAFYRLRDVMRITALSRSTIYRRVAEGRFPAPVRLGGRASAWQCASLQRWIDNPEGYQASASQN